MHECQEIRSTNINQKEDRFLIYERDLLSIEIILMSLVIGGVSTSMIMLGTFISKNNR